MNPFFSRKDEEPARNQATTPSVQHPAPVGRELLRLGPWKQHGIVHGVEEAILAEPSLLVHEDLLHHRDLPGRAAEAVSSDTDPDPERLPERHVVRMLNAAGPSRSAAQSPGQPIHTCRDAPERP